MANNGESIEEKDRLGLSENALRFIYCYLSAENERSNRFESRHVQAGGPTQARRNGFGPEGHYWLANRH